MNNPKLAGREGDWFVTHGSSAIRACVLVALHIFSSIATAGELEELSVTEADGEYTLRIVSVLDAPADYVYKIITDYKHAYRLNPTITDVEILPSGRDEVVRVRNLSKQCVGPFCFDIAWAGDIVETRDGDIEVKTIPQLSNFVSGYAIWHIRPQGEHTRVLYESRLKPSYFIPPVIGSVIIKKHIKDDTLATFKRIECQATIMFDRDMGNETELLSELSKEGRDCVNPEVLAELMHP
jgi:hypothetical protein